MLVSVMLEVMLPSVITSNDELYVVALRYCPAMIICEKALVGGISDIAGVRAKPKTRIPTMEK